MDNLCVCCRLTRIDVRREVVQNVQATFVPRRVELAALSALLPTITCVLCVSLDRLCKQVGQAVFVIHYRHLAKVQ